MNKLILSGRPTQDPGISYTGEGDRQMVIAKFTMASNRIYSREGEPRADFIPCVAFGRTAKIIEDYVKKGMLLVVTGPVRNNDYVNKDGQKVYGHQMLVESVEILEKKNGTEVNQNGFMNVEQLDEQIPFQEEDGVK